MDVIIGVMEVKNSINTFTNITFFTNITNRKRQC